MQIGIQPDILICRTERPLSEELKRKIAQFCNVDFGCGGRKSRREVDLRNPHQAPRSGTRQGGLQTAPSGDQRARSAGLGPRWWTRILKPPHQVRIAVVGKYTELADSYKSIHEALVHGGIANEAGVSIHWIASDRFTGQEARASCWRATTGCWCPAGSASGVSRGCWRRSAGAREHKLPFFGICLGLQTAIIEFARNVCKIPDTNSSEFAPECENPVIALMRSQEGIQEMGGTMRLGAYPCLLRPGSHAAQAYNATEVSERHRHRYEVSNAYRDVLAEYGMRCSGLSPDGSLRRNDRAAGPSVVHRLPVPSRAEVAADASAPAVRRLCGCGTGACENICRASILPR